MPNFKSISFEMAVLQGLETNCPPPCMCYPKDPMWNGVNVKTEKFSRIHFHWQLCHIFYIPLSFAGISTKIQIFTSFP